MTSTVSHSAAAPPLLRTDSLPFDLSSCLALACGMAAHFSINVIGELFWTEMLLPMFALGVAIRHWPAALLENGPFRVLMLTACLMLLGYVVSDVVAGTPPAKYLRGWSRVIALLVDIFSLSVIGARSRWNLWWYCLGWALAAFAISIATHMPITKWKIGYGDTFAMLAGNAGAFLPSWLSALTVAGLGAISVVLDYRSLGAALMVVGAILWGRRRRVERHAGSQLPLKLIVGLALVAFITVILLHRSERDFSQRREISNVTRFAALRVGAIAIAHSPIIGYGSWGQGTEQYAAMLYDQTVDDLVAVRAGQFANSSDSLLAHSQLIQAWMEGGLLAASFFLCYAYFILRELRYLLLAPGTDRLTTLFLLLLTTNLWHVAMSPFLGAHRLNIASAVAVIVVLSMLRGDTSAPVESISRAHLAPPNLLN